MTTWDRAVAAVHAGDIDALAALLGDQPALATATDDDGATLLTVLIDWPGRRPRAPETARLLVGAGCPVDGRRSADDGTPLSGAVCTEEAELCAALIALGADPHAANGWRPGTVLDLVSELAEDLSRRDHPERAALIATFTAATGETLPRRPGLAAPSPVLPCHDVRAAVDWYQQVLGFGGAEWFPNESAPTYAILGRGGTHVHLAQVAADATGTAGLVVNTDRVRAFHAAVVDAGGTVAQPVTDQPWGWTDFVVTDPHGNAIRIGSETEPDVSAS